LPHTAFCIENADHNNFTKQTNTMRVQYTINLSEFGLDLPLKPILIILTNILLGYFAYTWLTAEDESTVDFEVEIPEQCKKGWLEGAEVLESPSIQVRSPTPYLTACTLTLINRLPPLRPYSVTVLQTANFSAVSIQSQQTALIAR